MKWNLEIFLNLTMDEKRSGLYSSEGQTVTPTNKHGNQTRRQKTPYPSLHRFDRSPTLLSTGDFYHCERYVRSLLYQLSRSRMRKTREMIGLCRPRWQNEHYQLILPTQLEKAVNSAMEDWPNSGQESPPITAKNNQPSPYRNHLAAIDCGKCRRLVTCRQDMVSHL